MILSRILMILALAVLAYLVYIVMFSSETFKQSVRKTSGPEKFTGTQPSKLPHMSRYMPVFPPRTPSQPEQFVQPSKLPHMSKYMPVFPPRSIPSHPEQFVQSRAELPRAELPRSEPGVEPPHAKPRAIPPIKYERFANGVSDTVHGAAPFKDNIATPDIDYATVNFTGLIDGDANDSLQIEGTDLLTAPLVDNMLYTNSIANTNRNASQDLRGDIPLQYNDSYTPFNASTIYGAPLSQRAMTINNV